MFASYFIPAWEAATIVAAVAGVVGFFTVMRGASFAAHALPNGSFAGAAGAYLIGVNTLIGLGTFAMLGALTIATLGRRTRNDVATALTIVLMLGLGGLFIAQTREYAQAIFALLFGEAISVPNSYIVPTEVLGALCVLAIVLLYRPLLLTSVSPDAAEARGISPRLVDVAFLLILAMVTTMAVPVVGTLLIFALLVSPAASARCVTKSPLPSLVLSVALALATVWSSFALSYVANLPIGFFVGAIGIGTYAAARAIAATQAALASRRSVVTVQSGPHTHDVRSRA
ncbi:MAG TPA: metal ABC transporter permease [Acidimicrobiales bacterium]|nr:metal ABC transporter permease [Acidimicrobiales bacterium]